MTPDAPSAPRPLMVSSWNGAPATATAARLVREGTNLLDAIVRGVAIVEADPTEMTVGYGGLPNEEGDVELDAAVMDGPLHKAGAVAALKGIKHPAAVAMEVLRRTDHALLVGEGARRFARQVGFKEEDLLTPQAREAWLLWKSRLSSADAWIGASEHAGSFGRALEAGVESHVSGAQHAGAEPPRTWGTIHVSGLDAAGNLFACTSTSGLSYKIPGRVGDSALVGAGIFVDNAAGSAGATGRGEASLHNCIAYETVRSMEAGLSPTEAALASLRRLARNTKEPRLLDERGEPAFNVTVYALRKDGAFGAASLRSGYTFVVQEGDRTSVLPTTPLFATPAPL
ncbi:MAG: N(4)-(beta-N-acetylglucosaminyl)-L-asparaginase [Phycisphaerales bacterium]